MTVNMAFLPRGHLKPLHFSLIECHLHYVISLWGNAPQKLKKKIEIMQKKAIRIITSSNYNAPTCTLFKNLCILRLNDLYKQQLARFMHSIVNKKLPRQLYQLFNYSEPSHQYNTRNKLRIPLHKKSMCYSSFLRNGPKLWSTFH